MTSFMISQFIDRKDAYILDDECVFCKIIQRKELAHVLYEDEHVIAFLGTGLTPSMMKVI